MPTPESVVDNILAGRTADGVGVLGLAISFSKDPLTRQAAARLLGRVIAGIGEISPDDLTSLAAKLLSHLSKTGLQTVQGIHGFAVPLLVDALREAPEMLSGRAGIAAILRAHARRSQQAAAVLRKRLPPDVPPRKGLWAGSGGYRLEEATDPRHLVHDSVILGHCVGTLTMDAAQPRHRRPLAREEPLEQLWYWQEIVRGWLRILTLTLDDTPVFTLSFRTATRRIDQIQGKGVTGSPHIPCSLRCARLFFTCRSIWVCAKAQCSTVCCPAPKSRGC